MSIKPDYLRYLDHFGKTVTIRDFARDRDNSSLIALRHDVDHELDIALEMSYHEQRQGIRATYYLLDTAPYWSDPELVNKCLQMTDYGHEIGLHINVLAKWFKGDIADVKSDMQAVIGMLRKGGVDVKTVSTHGDPLCYNQQFINYWCFQELRPDTPVTRESGLSAEGIPVPDPRFQIHYPSGHQLQRPDGQVFQFWSVSMQELGLEYDAMHIPHDVYYSDSGGWWTRTPDPLEQDVSKGRVQVLMHPEYWRGPQKLYFFLSAPRSGSTWLANFIDKATPLTGKHEFSLNHRYEERTLTADKRTFDDLSSLLKKPDTAKSLLMQARAWIEDHGQDYGEANVYLHHFMPAMNEVFPDATLVLLHRHPADVVRSLLNRDWYDTPEDQRHPPVPIEHWKDLQQFEKVCWFARYVNENLMNVCHGRLSFEKMTTDPEGFISDMETLGIPVYPKLAKPHFSIKLNANTRVDHPSYPEWREDQKQSFADICGSICNEFGYELSGNTGDLNKNRSSNIAFVRERKEQAISLLSMNFRTKATINRAGKIYGAVYKKIFSEFSHAGIRRRVAPLYTVKVSGQSCNVSSKGCYLAIEDTSLSITTIPELHTNLVVGANSWDSIDVNEGWSASVGSWYRGSIKVKLSGNDTVMLLCLMYDDTGKLYDKRSLVRLDSSSNSRKFSFSTRVNTNRFALALYKPATKEESRFLLEHIFLEQISSVANQLN